MSTTHDRDENGIRAGSPLAPKIAAQLEQNAAREGAVVSSSTRSALRAFVAARDWDQFHTPENLAKSIAIEASELLECYQWGPEADPQDVRDELADVVTYCIHLANRLGVDLDEIVMSKLAKTEQKYPIELNQGSIHKRTEP
jgi:NTP pyrophosphatase (non-canonical NTP hydrolase)